MNYETSTGSAQNASSGQLIAGFLAAGVLFAMGYTLTRTVLSQPASQGENVAVNSVVPHEATLWNAEEVNL